MLLGMIRREQPFLDKYGAALRPV